MADPPLFLVAGAVAPNGDSGRSRPVPGDSWDAREVGQDPEPDESPGVVSESSARSLLVTLLGELVLPDGEPVWTASLLYAFAGLGISEPAARQTLARAKTTGWLTSERHGREARWTVTPAGAQMIEEITGRVFSLNTVPERWDGNCLILVVTIPHERRTVRKRLYSALSWAGFGSPAPGLWASPHVDRTAETAQLIEELGLRDSTIAFVGTTTSIGLSDHEIVKRAWNVDRVAARYATLLDTFADLEPAPGDDLLFAHLALVDQWHTFPAMDPQLPEDLLPDWIGRRAVRTFVDLHTRWRPGAREHWRRVVKSTSP